MKTLDIIDFGNNGEGIAKDNGKVYFVPKTIKGEKVEVEVVKEKSNFCECRLSKVINAAQDRIEPVCNILKNAVGVSCNILVIKISYI